MVLSIISKSALSRHGCLVFHCLRVFSDEKDRDQRLPELKKRLLDRDFNEDMVDAALKKAKAVPRKEALKQHTQSKQKSKGRSCVHDMTPGSQQSQPSRQNTGEP